MRMFGVSSGATRRISAVCAAFGMLLFAASCGDDDDGGGPSGPPVTGEEAVQASAGVALATLTSIGTVFDLPTGPGALKVGERSPSLREVIRIAFEAAASKSAGNECSGGGTADVTCFTEDNTTVFSSTWSQCVEETGLPDSSTITTDGSVSLVAEIPDACIFKILPDSIGVTLDLDFTIVRRDSLGAAIDSFGADVSIATEPTGAGCEGLNGVVTIDGTFTFLDALLGEGLSFSADNLTISASSEGDPCTSTLVVNGGASVEHDSEFSATYANLTLTHTEVAAGDSVTIDGTVTTNCVGTVVFDTIEGIIIPGDDECPIAGLVEVTIQGNTSAWISFTAEGGVEFDFDMDGEAEVIFPDCDDHDIPHCHNPA